jgi:ABC-type multidrug transport system ATPase subunit
LIQPTSGTAYFFEQSYDLRTDMQMIQSRIGVCMQFDVFYAKLTCLDHILFYARLKGYKESQVHQHACEVLTQVGLGNDMHKRACELSGGMRRRLSIGIAITGEVDILFLDEPSTGLDPSTRRHLWNVFQDIRKRRETIMGRPLSVILTTHAMDEADMLCDRIGIMHNGVLRCLGSAEYLKFKYSVGYTLTIQLEPELDATSVTEDMLSLLKRSLDAGNLEILVSDLAHTYGLASKAFTLWLVKEKSIGGVLVFQLRFINQQNGSKEFKWSQCFGVLNEIKSQQRPFLIPEWLSGFSNARDSTPTSESSKCVLLKDWGVTMTSLEDVFINVVKDL